MNTNSRFLSSQSLISSSRVHFEYISSTFPMGLSAVATMAPITNLRVWIPRWASNEDRQPSTQVITDDEMWWTSQPMAALQHCTWHALLVHYYCMLKTKPSISNRNFVEDIASCIAVSVSLRLSLSVDSFHP